MTSLAMVAGMTPLALGWGEGGEQSASLGRAVIGGLVAATLATLFVLPTVFAIVQAAPVGRPPRSTVSTRPAPISSRRPTRRPVVATSRPFPSGENGRDEFAVGPHLREVGEHHDPAH